MELKYVVTGTGRSGTVYMARFLTSVGIPCGHETIFDWKGITWAKKRLEKSCPLELSYVSKASKINEKWKDLPQWLENIDSIVAESSYMAAPFLKDSLLANAKIIHVVRDPVKVINSFCNYIDYFQGSEPSNTYEQLIYRQVQELKKPMPAYDRACLFWVRWNQMIQKPDFFFRVEDDPKYLMEFLGVTGRHFQDTSINTLKKTTNEKFSIDKIQSEEIKSEFIQLGKQYGYRMALEYLLV